MNVLLVLLLTSVLVIFGSLALFLLYLVIGSLLVWL